MIQTYGDDINDEAIKFEVEFEIEIGGWGTQGLKGLMHLIRELELDK